MINSFEFTDIYIDSSSRSIVPVQSSPRASTNQFPVINTTEAKLRDNNQLHNNRGGFLATGHLEFSRMYEPFECGMALHDQRSGYYELSDHILPLKTGSQIVLCASLNSKVILALR